MDVSMGKRLDMTEFITVDKSFRRTGGRDIGEIKCVASGRRHPALLGTDARDLQAAIHEFLESFRGRELILLDVG